MVGEREGKKDEGGIEEGGIEGQTRDKGVARDIPIL